MKIFSSHNLQYKYDKMDFQEKCSSTGIVEGGTCLFNTTCIESEEVDDSANESVRLDDLANESVKLDDSVNGNVKLDDCAIESVNLDDCANERKAQVIREICDPDHFSRHHVTELENDKFNLQDKPKDEALLGSQEKTYDGKVMYTAIPKKISRAARKRKQQRLKLGPSIKRHLDRQVHNEVASSVNGCVQETEDCILEDRVVCPICLDLYYIPYKCHPCGHSFCEPCLRHLSMKYGFDQVQCPLCRTRVLSCYLDDDLASLVTRLHPKLYQFRQREERRNKSNLFTLPYSELLQQEALLHLIKYRLTERRQKRQQNRRQRQPLSSSDVICIAIFIAIGYVILILRFPLTESNTHTSANNAVVTIFLLCLTVYLGKIVFVFLRKKTKIRGTTTKGKFVIIILINIFDSLGMTWIIIVYNISYTLN